MATLTLYVGAYESERGERIETHSTAIPRELAGEGETRFEHRVYAIWNVEYSAEFEPEVSALATEEEICKLLHMAQQNENGFRATLQSGPSSIGQ